MSLFSFFNAREPSPAFYISYNVKYKSNCILKHTGNMVQFDEYTPEIFQNNILFLARAIEVDAIKIEEQSAKFFTARFWFD